MNIQEVRAFLKKNFEGPEVVEALRLRLQTHLTDPSSDPLSNQVWPAYNALPGLLIEPFTLLDAGCMSGFLYHHLKKSLAQFEYTGMDRWQEALTVGREFAPEVTFIHGDFLSEFDGEWDYVVCSNIPFRNQDEYDRAIVKLLPHARRQLVMIHPDSRMSIFGPTRASQPDSQDDRPPAADF